jgi:hypothetical protein
MTNKTLFTAVEAELRNARAAINNADAYMNMLKNAMDSMVKATGIEASLSESEKYEKLIAVSKKLKEHSNLL